MERVELLNGSSSSSAEEHSKSLTSIEADYSIEEFCDENTRLMEYSNSREASKHNGKVEEPVRNMDNNVFGHPNNNRRSDEPTELSFEKCTYFHTLAKK